MMITRFGTPWKSPLPIIMKAGFLAGTGWASVSCWATPVSRRPMPSVMMKGSVFWWTERNPFTKPTTMPKTTASAMANSMGMYSCSLIERMPDTTRIPPMERSQPPAMIVNVTPKERMRRIEVELSMSRRLYAV